MTADGLGEGDSHRHCHQGEQIHRLLVGPWPDLGRGLGAGWEDLGKQLETLSTNQSYLATVPFCSSVSGSPVPHGDHREGAKKQGRQKREERREREEGFQRPRSRLSISGGSSEAEV